MRTGEREVGRRVIKTRQVSPCFHRMAGFTPGRRAAGVFLGHAIRELSLVRICVTLCAGKAGEPKTRDGRSAVCLFRLVAVCTWNGNVRTDELEASQLVCGEGERRWSEAINSVASLAPIVMRSSSELVGMRVLVAVSAGCEPYLILRFLTCRNVALRARHRSVLALERICRLLVLRHPEARWLKALYRVTALALASVGSLRELSAVWIGFMAISALVEWDGLFEVSPPVTLRTLHAHMLPQQWILSFGVIEVPCQVHTLPSCGCVTALARLLERALVRILVAPGATVENKTEVVQIFLIAADR